MVDRAIMPDLLAAAFISALFPVLLWISGVWTEAEKRFFFEAVKKGRASLRLLSARLTEPRPD